MTNLDSGRPYPVNGDDIPAADEPKPVDNPEKTPEEQTFEKRQNSFNSFFKSILSHSANYETNEPNKKPKVYNLDYWAVFNSIDYL